MIKGGVGIGIVVGKGRSRGNKNMERSIVVVRGGVGRGTHPTMQLFAPKMLLILNGPNMIDLNQTVKK